MSRINGYYEPNEAGARTLADAKPLYIGHDKVTAQIYGDRMCAVFVGIHLVHEESLPDGITESYQVNPYVREIALRSVTQVAFSHTEPVTAAKTSKRVAWNAVDPFYVSTNRFLNPYYWAERNQAFRNDDAPWVCRPLHVAFPFGVPESMWSDDTSYAETETY